MNARPQITRLVLDSEITEGLVEAILREINKVRDCQQLELRISSKGGNRKQSVKLHNVISRLGVPVIGIVDGYAWSGACVVLQACTTRLACPGATFKIHNIGREVTVRVVFGDTVRNAVARFRKLVTLGLKEIKVSQAQVDRLLARRTGKSVKLIREMSDQDKVLTAQEALQLGLIDKIL